jgi:hypothetical protein
MIELNDTNTLRASAKSRAERPLVRFVAFRHYQVTNRAGATYNVRFDKRDGKPMAECDCAAGKAERFVCYHVTSALPHHQMIAAANRAGLNWKPQTYPAFASDGRRVMITIPA